MAISPPRFSPKGARSRATAPIRSPTVCSHNALLLNRRGYALFRDKKYAGAITSYERALKLDPKAAEIHYNLALALWKSDRRDDAKAELRRAYKVDPHFREVAKRDPQSKELRAALAR